MKDRGGRGGVKDRQILHLGRFSEYLKRKIIHTKVSRYHKKYILLRFDHFLFLTLGNILLISK